MTNIMSTAIENHGLNQEEYADVFENFLGKRIFDLIVMAKLEKAGGKKELEKVLSLYRDEHSFPIGFSKKSKRTRVVDIGKIDEKNMRLRHSVSRMAGLWPKLLGTL